MKYLIVLLLISGCSSYAPVSNHPSSDPECEELGRKARLKADGDPATVYQVGNMVFRACMQGKGYTQ